MTELKTMRCDCGREVLAGENAVSVRCWACTGKAVMKREQQGWKCQDCGKALEKPAPRCKECETNAAIHKRVERYEKKAGHAAPKKTGGMSGLDAAHKVLLECGERTSDEIAALAVEKGYWSTSGKTPGATLYVAITRAIAKGDGRFTKTGGKTFSANA